MKENQNKGTMTKRKLVKVNIELPEDIKIVQIDASASGELFPVENPDAAICDFFKDQMNILKEK